MIPSRIIWHHSAINKDGDQLKQIDAYHKQRDFPLSKRGYYVGYHYLIERSGLVTQCRDLDEIGAHDQGENLNSIGICLAGDFTAMLPNEAQTKTAATIVAEIRAAYFIPINRIEPHRWDDNTQCPGAFLPDNWLVKKYLEYEGSPILRAVYWLCEAAKLL